MRLLKAGIFRVMAIQAQRRRALGQVKLVLRRQVGARLVRRMAGVAPHIERRVAATLLWDIRPLGVTAEAQVFFFVPGRRFQQLVLVV